MHYFNSSVAYLHYSVLVRPIDGQILYIWLVTWNCVALVILGGESLSVFASESRITERVGRVIRIQQTRDAHLVVGLWQPAKRDVTVLLAEASRLILWFERK